MAVLGIDTSNYRTSICVINENYDVLAQENPLIPVAEGELGLQQSQAVFKHLDIFPSLIKKIKPSESIKAIGVSVSPRPQPDSYMPVFKVGEVLAETLAHFLSVPLLKTSHQEGHVAAGEYSIDQKPSTQTFLAVHLSGGTSEVLHCKRTPVGYDLERLGGSIDIQAGQLVDRVGVQLGLSFPAGPQLEKLAADWAVDGINHNVLGKIPFIPSYVQNYDFSFSGPEAQALRLINDSKYSAGQIARAVENVIAKTLEKSLLQAMKQTSCKEILLVGGVASNQHILHRLRHRLEHRAIGAKLFVAPPEYATDNAFGVACLALQYAELANG